MTTFVQPAVTSSSTSFADLLKAETQTLHTAAERHPLQAELLRGSLPIATFAALHAQHLLVHRVLEGHLVSLRHSHEAFAAIVKDHHFRAARFECDLGHLGVNAESIVANEPTRVFIALLDRSARETPLELLGVFYVLEGSTNGAKYIAAAMNRAYSLNGRGISALDPHGDAQRERWTTFRSELDSLARTLDDSDRAAILEAAGATFQYAIDVMEACRGT